MERLSKDLQSAFPDMKGFSPRNLWDMRRLSEVCRQNPKLRQAVAEIPWGHNLVLLNSVKNKDHFVAEYALRDIQKPIGVAKWQTRLVESLPKELKGRLPSVEQIERELRKKS